MSSPVRHWVHYPGGGAGPPVFFGQAKKGRRNALSFLAREGKKEKGRENSFVSEGKRREEM